MVVPSNRPEEQLQNHEKREMKDLRTEEELKVF